MILRLATLLPANRMSVVDSNQPLAIPSMQSKRVIQSVRLLRRDRHLY